MPWKRKGKRERGARGEMKGLAPKSRRSGICRRAREEGSHRVKIEANRQKKCNNGWRIKGNTRG